MWLLIAFLLLLAATAVILLPFFRSPAVGPDIEVDPTLLALYNRRDQLYQAIREAKFDLDTGKLTPEDYERQVAQLKRQAASVLRAIDRRQEALSTSELDALVEEMVRAERQQRPLVASPQPAVVAPSGTSAPSARYCPQCGARVQPGDRFCPACGARLS